MWRSRGAWGRYMWWYRRRTRYGIWRRRRLRFTRGRRGGLCCRRLIHTVSSFTTPSSAWRVSFSTFHFYSLYHVLVCNKNVVSSFWIQLYNTYNISFNLHHPRSSTIIIAINFYFETRSGQWAIFWRIISNLHETPSVVFGFTTVTVLCVGFLLSIKHMAFCKLMVCLNITYFTEIENIVVK